MTSRSIIVVGFELGARLSEEEVGKFAYLPPPPGNYKSDEAIGKWKEEAKGKARKAVHECKLNTVIDQVYAVNLTTKSVYSNLLSETPVEGEDEQPAPAHGFLAWLLGEQGAVYHEFLPADSTTPAFYGFDVKMFLRALGVEAISSGLPVPLPLWYSNTQWYDPYDMLVEAEVRSYLPLESVCRMAGVPFHEVGEGECVKDAKLVTELVTRYGLAPLAPEPRAAVKKTKKA